MSDELDEKSSTPKGRRRRSPFHKAGSAVKGLFRGIWPGRGQALQRTTSTETSSTDWDTTDSSLTEIEQECVEQVKSVFPDICPDFLQRILEERGHLPKNVLNHIINEMEAGRDYARRVELEDEEADEPLRTSDDKETATVLPMKECGCCFTEKPINRFVYCSGLLSHPCCVDCFQTQASVLVGQTCYEIKCMVVGGCEATYPQTARQKFLRPSLLRALECNEQKISVRAAGLDGLVECPFCPYAEVYPPAEEDKEFRCRRPGCKKTSCRSCHKVTHLPLDCEAIGHKIGPGLRLQIEEAMSAAVIRKCNKCSAPFIKKFGCNRITCYRPGCGNVQCYVCSQNCTDYGHFYSSGLQTGSCPLYDTSSEDRHEVELQQARREAKLAVAAENPGLNPHDLDFAMSSNVKHDDLARREREMNGQLIAEHYNWQNNEAGQGGDRLDIVPYVDHFLAHPFWQRVDRILGMEHPVLQRVDRILARLVDRVGLMGGLQQNLMEDEPALPDVEHVEHVEHVDQAANRRRRNRRRH